MPIQIIESPSGCTTGNAPLEPVSKFTSHLRQHGLDLQTRVGSGGYGTVISAKDLVGDRLVAVKIVENAKTEEIELWPRLLHPHVLPVYSVQCIETSVTAFVTPLHKCDLMFVLLDFEVTISAKFNRIRRWIAQVTKGLAYLHDGGIFHLDLKPNNILISESGRAILSDFSFITTRKKTSSYEYCLPLKYMAPEVLESNFQDAICFKNSFRRFETCKLDSWAFGITVLEVVTNFSLGKYMIKRRQKSYGFPGVSNWQTWNKTVKSYAKIVHSEPKKFATLIRQAYRKSAVTSQVAESCRFFLRNLLQQKAGKRGSIQSCLAHPFVQDSSHPNVEKADKRILEAESIRRVEASKSDIPQVRKEELQDNIFQEYCLESFVEDSRKRFSDVPRSCIAIYSTHPSSLESSFNWIRPRKTILSNS